jgi:hypothetical protein
VFRDILITIFSKKNRLLFIDCGVVLERWRERKRAKIETSSNFDTFGVFGLTRFVAVSISMSVEIPISIVRKSKRNRLMACEDRAPMSSENSCAAATPISGVNASIEQPVLTTVSSDSVNINAGVLTTPVVSLSADSFPSDQSPRLQASGLLAIGIGFVSFRLLLSIFMLADEQRRILSIRFSTFFDAYFVVLLSTTRNKIVLRSCNGSFPTSIVLRRRAKTTMDGQISAGVLERQSKDRQR